MGTPESQRYPLTDHRRQRTQCEYLLNVVEKSANLACTLAYYLNSADFRFIPGKSRTRYVICCFKKFKCEDLYSVQGSIQILSKIKQLANRLFINYTRFCRKIRKSPSSLISQGFKL